MPSLLLLTRKGLERKWESHRLGGSGSPGSVSLDIFSIVCELMKRYSITLIYHGLKCSLVTYLLDGDNLPLSPIQKGQ